MRGRRAYFLDVNCIIYIMIKEPENLPVCLQSEHSVSENLLDRQQFGWRPHQLSQPVQN